MGGEIAREGGRGDEKGRGEKEREDVERNDDEMISVEDSGSTKILCANGIVKWRLFSGRAPFLGH